MFYFIPSWYNEYRQWYDDTPIWSRVYEKMDFDDTVNQLKMFQRADEDCLLMVLSYRPQLRYFLHKEGLQTSRYWSFFDDVQNIGRFSTKAIDFKELNWPEQVTFLYSPFIVLAQQHGKTIASIYFAENGNLLKIDWQEDGQVTQTLLFDDRGFLSSRLVLKDGRQLFQDYLNENGVWQLREYLDSENAKIEVNPYADQTFQKEYYNSWGELLIERLQLFAEQQMTVQDKLVIACDKRHNDLLLTAFTPYQKIFSFFGQRFDVTDSEALRKIVEQSALIVTEKVESKEAVLASFTGMADTKKLPTVLVSTPFDTRLRLGHSQSQKELDIYFFMDTINVEKRQRVLRTLLEMMGKNPAIRLILASYNSSLNAQNFQQEIDQLIIEDFDPSKFFSLAEDSGENQIDTSEELENHRISVEVITSETQIIALLDRVRLVMDLGQKPDLYTQIASISAGIPQINQVKTEYVAHRRNGWILSSEQELTKAIHYYFDGLRNWNDSLVYTVEKMGDYTSGKLLAKWKEELAEK